MAKSFDLRRKKVIDVDTAEKIGYIHDMDIDVESGKIRSVSIPKSGILGLFSFDRAVTVPWESVLAIGSEFVIVRQKNMTKQVTN